MTEYRSWTDMMRGEYPLHVAAARLRYECECFLALRHPARWYTRWYARLITRQYERELRRRPEWQAEVRKRKGRP